jgi:hypothetical protein
MDSKLIFQANRHNSLKVKWLMLADTEWVYFGVGQEINKDYIKSIVEEHIGNGKMYVSYTRNESFEVNGEGFMKGIQTILDSNDFSIWDSKFEKVIEFNKIGVFRKGERI